MRAVLFDVDGTLISSGGAGAASWRLAFDDLYGIPVDITRYTDEGMTEPEVASRSFESALGRQPSKEELAQLMSRRMSHLPLTVAESKAFRVLPGVRETLARLHATGYPPRSDDRRRRASSAHQATHLRVPRWLVGEERHALHDVYRPPGFVAHSHAHLITTKTHPRHASALARVLCASPAPLGGCAEARQDVGVSVTTRSRPG